MSYADKIKAKIKEVDVEKQLHELVDEGEKLVNEAVTTAGEIAYDRRGDVQTWLDKASGKVNEKTDGKYAEKIDQFTAMLLEGVDKIAERRTGTDGAESSDMVAEPIPLPTAEPGEPEPPADSATEPSTDVPPPPVPPAPFPPEPFPPAPDPDVNPGGGPSVDPEAPGADPQR